MILKQGTQSYKFVFQSLNFVENPCLRRIFMLLQEELKDSDIPHRTTIQNHIKEIWDEHLAGLESKIKVLKIQLISIVMGTQFIIILPIAHSGKGFLDH